MRIQTNHSINDVFLHNGERWVINSIFIDEEGVRYGGYIGHDYHFCTRFHFSEEEMTRNIKEGFFEKEK